jgi:hypothetical protein
LDTELASDALEMKLVILAAVVLVTAMIPCGATPRRAEAGKSAVAKEKRKQT